MTKQTGESLIQLPLRFVKADGQNCELAPTKHPDSIVSRGRKGDWLNSLILMCFQSGTGDRGGRHCIYLIDKYELSG